MRQFKTFASSCEFDLEFCKQRINTDVAIIFHLHVNASQLKLAVSTFIYVRRAYIRDPQQQFYRNYKVTVLNNLLAPQAHKMQQSST
jgi:hypothetical protein